MKFKNGHNMRKEQISEYEKQQIPDYANQPNYIASDSSKISRRDNQGTNVIATNMHQVSQYGQKRD